MGIFLLWVKWSHECMAIIVKTKKHPTSGRFKRAGSM